MKKLHPKHPARKPCGHSGCVTTAPSAVVTQAPDHAAKPDSAGRCGGCSTAVAPDSGRHAAKPASVEEIRLLAYRRWEGAGRPDGEAVQFWLQAEQELSNRR